MKIWFIKWAAIVLLSNGPTFLDSEGGPKFETKAECEEALAEAQPRMGDWIRGSMHLNLHVEVQVHGECQVEGKPA